MKYNSGCMLCEGPIVNLICFRCMGDEIKVWLQGKDKKLVKVLEGNDFLLKSYNRDGRICIECGREMNVCVDCYAYEVSELLELYGPHVSNEFKQLFNIQVERHRY